MLTCSCVPAVASLPSLDLGTCSSMAHITSCPTPPTLRVTRLLSCRDLEMMKGSGAGCSETAGGPESIKIKRK